MRAIHLFVAAGILAIVAGCGNNNTAYYQEETVAIGPPRVNLYPLTAPPPGSVQPLQGSAPTRISGAATAEYAPAGAPMPAPGYAGGGYVATAVPAPSPVQTQYNPAMGYTEPFPTGNYCPPWVPAGANCTVENMTAGMNPIVPIGDPPVIINNTATGQSYTTTTSQLNQAYPGTGYAAPTYAQPAQTYAAPAYTPPATSGYVAPYPAPTIVNTSYTPPTQPTYSTYTATPTPTSTQAPASTQTQPNFGAPFPLSSVQPSPSAEQLSDVASAQSGPSVQGNAGSTLPVNTSVSYNASELRLVPAPDIPPGNHPSDAAPSQWFEIIRPGNGPIRIGRLTSTCVCVSPRVPNRFVGAGERALIEARIVSRPPANNLTYGIYVGVVEPVQATVDADVTISLR